MAAKYWVLGRDLTALTVYIGTRATDGTISWATTSIPASASLLGLADYIRVGDRRMLEMITSVDATYAHYELTLLDSSLIIGEILNKKAGVGSVLAYLAQNAQFVKVVFTRGLGTYTYLGSISDFTDGIVAFGKNAAELTLRPVDSGSAPLGLSGT